MSLDFSRCRPVRLLDGTLSPPFQHVKDGVEWLVAKPEPYALLANDMGGSKSAQAIIAALFLFHQSRIDRAIVVAPAGVRPRVWFSEELGQLGEHLWDDTPCQVSEYHAKIRKWRRGPDAPRTFKWIVTNYEWIRGKGKVEPLLEYCGPKTLLILDESSTVKGRDSAQTEACMLLRWQVTKRAIRVGVPRCGFVYLLNGTPFADGPEDLFSQGNLMHPDIHGCKYITHFRNHYASMEPVRGAGGRALTDRRGNPIQQVKAGAAGWPGLPELTKRFEPHVLRQDWRANSDIPDALPVQILTVPLKESWKAYKNLRDDMVHWLESGDVAITDTAAVRVMRLAQVTSGILGGVEDGRMEDADPGLAESLGLSKAGDRIDLPGSFLDGVVLQQGGADAINAQREWAAPLIARRDVSFVGREKLDFLLNWQAEKLHEDPHLKLLVWCRFVPELRRYLLECQARFGHEVGAVCGQPVFEGGKVKAEREHAERLLHPRTSPSGPLTVGGTYGSGGLGLNFTAFHVVFNLSQVYEDWKRRQADKRVDRPGQTRGVAQFDLVAEGPKGQKTIDTVIALARKEKRDLNEWGAAQWVKALGEE